MISPTVADMCAVSGLIHRNFYPHYPNTPSADALRSPVFRTMQKLRDVGN